MKTIQLLLALFAASLAAFAGDIPARGTIYPSIKLTTGEMLTAAKFMSFSESTITFAVGRDLRAIPLAQLPTEVLEPFAQRNREIVDLQKQYAAKEAEMRALEAHQREVLKSIKMVRVQRSILEDKKFWQASVEAISLSEIQVIYSCIHEYSDRKRHMMMTLSPIETDQMAKCFETFTRWDQQSRELKIDVVEKLIGQIGGRDVVFKRRDGFSSLHFDSAFFYDDDISAFQKLYKQLPEAIGEMQKQTDGIFRAAALK